MATISETHASLRFFGDDLDPHEVTVLLGGTPSRSASKGEVIRSGRSGREGIAKTGSWIMSVERREPGDLDAQLEELLSPLSSDLAVWRTLAKFRPNLFVGLFLRESNEGIDIDSHSLSLLAERGILLGLDVYGAASELRNIQIIDDADNATFSLFQATDDEFNQIFPAIGQDMELVEDFFQRLGESRAAEILKAIWERPVLKRDAKGIHGSLFYNHKSKRQHVPNSKREVDLKDSSINAAQRRLFAEHR